MKIEIELAEEIIRKIDRESLSLGVTQQELLRVVIGEKFAHLVEPYHPSPIPPHMEKEFEPSEVSFAKVAAVMGQLKCKGCTQDLNVSDVKSGFCKKCNTEVFK